MVLLTVAIMSQGAKGCQLSQGESHPESKGNQQCDGKGSQLSQGQSHSVRGNQWTSTEKLPDSVISLATSQNRFACDMYTVSIVCYNVMIFNTGSVQ